MGRLLIGVGFVLVGVGTLVMLFERFNIALGRLPGDIVIRNKGTTFYFPVVTCLIMSLLGTLALWLFNRR